MLGCEEDSGGGEGGAGGGGGGGEGENQELRQESGARGPRRARKRELNQEVPSAPFSVLYNYIKAR